MNDVGIVITAIVTGNYSTDEDYKVGTITYTAESQFDPSITCSNCYVDLDINVVFELNIEDYTLQSLQLYGEGNAEMGVEAEFTYKESMTYSNEWALTTLTMPPIDFVVGGIPFTLQITVPIHGGNITIVEMQLISFSFGKCSSLKKKK